MSFRDIFLRFQAKMKAEDAVDTEEDANEVVLAHLDELEAHLKGYIAEEVALQVSRASGGAALGAGRVLHPESDVKPLEDLNSPAAIALAAAQAQAAAAAPVQPAPAPVVVAETAQDQVELAQNAPAILQPEPGALPGSTGSVAQVADDGSTTVTSGVKLDGGASTIESTIDPDQTPAPQTASESGAVVEPAPAAPPSPTAAEVQADMAQGVAQDEALAGVEPEAADTAPSAPVATLAVDPDTQAPVIVTSDPTTGAVLSTVVDGATTVTAGTVVVDPVDGTPTVDHTLVEGAAPVTLGETTDAHPDIPAPEAVVAADPAANVAAAPADSAPVQPEGAAQ